MVQLDSYIITPEQGWLATYDQSKSRKPIRNCHRHTTREERWSRSVLMVLLTLYTPKNPQKCYLICKIGKRSFIDFKPPIYSFLGIQTHLRCTTIVLKSTTTIVGNYDAKALRHDELTMIVMMWLRSSSEG